MDAVDIARLTIAGDTAAALAALRADPALLAATRQMLDEDTVTIRARSREACIITAQRETALSAILAAYDKGTA